MFIQLRRNGYNRHGGPFCQGRFLILMSVREGSAVKVRGLVRYVSMASWGNFMVARLIVKGHKLALSGSYGADGLTMSVPQEVYDMGTDLPSELYDMWAKGGGWNACGSEAPAMRQWALKAFAPKPKKVRPLYPQGKLSADQNYVWERRFLSDMSEIIFSHISRMTTHAQLTADLVARIYSHPVYARLYRASRAYLAGYMSASSDSIYRQHLEWRMWVDDALRTKKEIDLLDAWSRVNSEKSAHVWMKDPSRVYSGSASVQ